jgi:kinesin family protein 18/19
MVGRKDDDLEPGLTYLTVLEIFKRLQEMNQQYESEISISYLEVYNEQVKDLLTPSENILNVLEHPEGVLIPKLTQHKPEDVADILRLLKDGNSRRTQHPTDQNRESSRSHAVFQVSFEFFVLSERILENQN